MVRALSAIAILVCGLAVSAFAAGDELAALSIGGSENCCGPVFIHYVPSLTTIINAATPQESGFTEIRVAKLRLSARSGIRSSSTTPRAGAPIPVSSSA